MIEQDEPRAHGLREVVRQLQPNTRQAAADRIHAVLAQRPACFDGLRQRQPLEALHPAPVAAIGDQAIRRADLDLGQRAARSAQSPAVFPAAAT